MSVNSIAMHDHSLTITWNDGEQSEFYYIWLRDNAPENRHANGQKLVDTATIDLEIRPKLITHADTIAIEWDDGTTSHFDPAWLRATLNPQRWQPTLWDGELDTLPSADFAAMNADQTILTKWLQGVRDYGFALVHNVPIESQALFKVVDLFGYVRETNYGRYFDVQAVADPINLAYTGLALGGHTDNPYRNPVPTLQLLHCLQNSAAGGESTLVDGWRVAEEIRQIDPDAFGLLTTIPVKFRFRSEDADLSAESPYIQLNAHDEIIGMRFNNRSAEPFTCPPDQMLAFYRAHRLLATLLEDDRFKITFKLSAGDLFIVDNTRVLHGRTGYTGVGTRHLQGCYADKDSLLSKLAVLQR